MKRLLSIVVIVVLSLSMITVPVYAANSGVIGIGSITILPDDPDDPDPDDPDDPTGDDNSPLDVYIPTNTGFVINPYQMKIRAAKGVDGLAPTVIGVYGTEYVQGIPEDKDYWKIVNNSKKAVTGQVYATYETNRWLQLNASEGDVDSRKRQLTLDLKIDDTSIPLLEKAPEDWNDSNVVTFGIDAGSIAKITLTGETGSGNQEWSFTDFCNITMAFKFEAA